MALFKKKRTLEEILEDVKALSPDEKLKFTEKMNEIIDEVDAPVSEDNANNETKAPAESGEGTPTEGEEPTKDDEEVKDTENGEIPSEDLETEEDRDDAPSPADPTSEPPSNETPTEPERYAEVIEAISARLTTLEESYNAVLKQLESMADRLDGGDFGNARGTPPEGNEDAYGEDSRVMRSYYSKQGDARRI